MIETIECKGKWKLPKSDEWINGSLIYNPEEGSRLELYGTFNPSLFDRDSQEIIIGETTKGKVTLVDNWYRTTKTRNNGVTIGIYEPYYVFFNYHFSDSKDIIFRNVVFRVFNLFQWLNITGFKYDFDNSGKKFSINYNQPEHLLILKDERLEGKIILDSSLETQAINNRSEITEQCFISFDYKVKTDFREILNDIRHFVGLITLCTYEQSYPTRITFKDSDYVEEVNHFTREKQIQCIYHNIAYNSKHKYRRQHEHLVKFNDIKNDILSIVQGWYDRYEEIEPTYDLMLYSFREKNHFKVEKFMDVIRALETFHRRTQINYMLPKQEYKLKVKKIIDSVDEAEKSFLKDLLNFANEPRLRDRLYGLLEKYNNAFLDSQITDIEKFCQDTVRSRNYYTHYDKSLRKKALDGYDLFILNKKLMGLLISCLLRFIGVKNGQFEKGLLYLLKE